MSGGYPYEAIGTVQDDLYCVVCLNLMKDAMQLDNCDHGMCNICLRSITKASQQSNTNPSCPTCRQTININKVHPAKMVNKLIKCIKVKCLYADNGCNWQGDVVDAKPHMDSKCLYQDITCLHAQNGCEIKVPRHALEDHVQKCEFRQIHCDYCCEEFVYNFIPIHMQVCDNVPVLCPNGCNVEVIRKNTNEHLKTCPAVSIECHFKDVGCSQKMLRSGLHDHEVSSVTSHLLCTKRKLETALGASNQKLGILELELQEAKKKLGDVEVELEETKKMLGDVESEHKDIKKKLDNVEKKLEEACDHLKKCSLKSEVDIQYETMILENYKTILSSYSEKFKTKLSDNLVGILSKLLNSSDAVNDAFADLVVKNLQDFAKAFIKSVPSVEDYLKQIESTVTEEFGEIWLLRLKQHFVTKAVLEFSFFKSTLLYECEKYHNDRANSILMICMENKVFHLPYERTTVEYERVKLDDREGEPRLIDSKIIMVKGLKQQGDPNCSTGLVSLSISRYNYIYNWTEAPDYILDRYFGFRLKQYCRSYSDFTYYCVEIELPKNYEQQYARNGYVLVRHQTS